MLILVIVGDWTVTKESSWSAKVERSKEERRSSRTKPSVGTITTETENV